MANTVEEVIERMRQLFGGDRPPPGEDYLQEPRLGEKPGGIDFTGGGRAGFIPPNPTRPMPVGGLPEPPTDPNLPWYQKPWQEPIGDLIQKLRDIPWAHEAGPEAPPAPPPPGPGPVVQMPWQKQLGPYAPAPGNFSEELQRTTGFPGALAGGIDAVTGAGAPYVPLLKTLSEHPLSQLVRTPGPTGPVLGQAAGQTAPPPPQQAPPQTATAADFNTKETALKPEDLEDLYKVEEPTEAAPSHYGPEKPPTPVTQPHETEPGDLHQKTPVNVGEKSVEDLDKEKKRLLIFRGVFSGVNQMTADINKASRIRAGLPLNDIEPAGTPELDYLIHENEQQLRPAMRSLLENTFHEKLPAGIRMDELKAAYPFMYRFAATEAANKRAQDRLQAQKDLEEQRHQNRMEEQKARGVSPRLIPSSGIKDLSQFENFYNMVQRAQEYYDAAAKDKAIGPVVSRTGSLWKAISGSDLPSAVAFRNQVGQVNAQYRYIITGKQSAPDERAELARQTFQNIDSPEVFRKEVQQMTREVQDKHRVLLKTFKGGGYNAGNLQDIEEEIEVFGPNGEQGTMPAKNWSKEWEDKGWRRGG